MLGLGIGYQFYSRADFMFGLACKYFMGAIVAGAIVMELHEPNEDNPSEAQLLHYDSACTLDILLKITLLHLKITLQVMFHTYS